MIQQRLGKLSRERIVFAGAVSAIWIADRFSKIWAAGSLRKVGEIRIFKYLYLTYAENTGAAFSLFRGSNLGLGFVSAGVLAFMALHRKEWVKDAASRWGFLLVFGGALGNLCDRVLFGYVVDFIDLRVWPIFNVADSCITTGTALLLLSFFRR